jgi:hypothetical protein
MSLLILPVEIVHRVLDYCDAQTILLSVRCVCKRLNMFVNTYNRYNLIFESKSSSSIQAISHLIQPNNVVSLFVSDNHQTRNLIELFTSLFAINRFTNLRSLALYRINDDKLKYVLENMNMTHAISLSILSCEREHAKTWTHVLSALVRCNVQKLSMINIDYKMNHITWPNHCKLDYLAIQDCTYDEYLVILRQLPNLRTLVMRQCIFQNSADTQWSPSTSLCHSLLTSLTITDCSVSLGNLTHLVAPIPSLQYLKLISYRQSVDYVLNGSIWQEFIQTKLPVLGRFDFFFSYTYCRDQHFTSLESIMGPFRAPFYLNDKHWFVTCAYVPRSRAVWLYTTTLCTTGYASLIRCELSSTDTVYRLIQRSNNERRDTIVDQVCPRIYST